MDLKLSTIMKLKLRLIEKEKKKDDQFTDL